MALEDDALLKVAERMEDECEKTKDRSILPDSQDPEMNLASPDRCDSVDALQVEARQLRAALEEKDREIEALRLAAGRPVAGGVEATGGGTKQ